MLDLANKKLLWLIRILKKMGNNKALMKKKMKIMKLIIIIIIVRKARIIKKIKARIKIRRKIIYKIS